MGFKKFTSLFVTETPTTDFQRIANKIQADESFPPGTDYIKLSKYVQTNAKWFNAKDLQGFKEAYAVFADVFNIATGWENSLDYIQANKPEHFNELTAQQKETLLNWISENLEPFRTKSYISKRNSYRLKHNFEFSEEGFYITNGQFKGAMLASGFIPKDYDTLNWYFTLGKNAGVTVM